MNREELTGYSYFKVATVNGIIMATFVYENILDEQLIRKIKDELLSLVELTSRGFVLNFEGVRLMSNAMIGGLVRLNKMTKDRNIPLRLCGIGPNIMEVLKITRLNLVFKIHATEENALSSL